MLLLFLLENIALSQDQKNMIKLKYVMDPHCGWCYGNSDNISWLHDQLQGRVELEVIAGGMWLGANAPAGGNELHQFIKTHSPQMERITGVEVGQKFYDLVNNPDYTFSSLEPSAAIVLVKQLTPEKALAFTKELQKTTFLDGKRLDQLDTYLPILKQCGIDEVRFAELWMKADNIKDTEAEFNASKVLARSYPTLLIEINGETKPIVAGYFNKEEVLEKIEILIN